MAKSFEYKHIVGFEETNLVGNVYYANFVRWQGRCREMFIHKYSPDVVEMFKHGFAMVTTNVSCDFISELYAFDQIEIRMKLGGIRQNRITMLFEYWRMEPVEEMVAKGEQGVACMQRAGEAIEPAPIPASLLEALQEYAHQGHQDSFRRAA